MRYQQEDEANAKTPRFEDLPEEEQRRRTNIAFEYKTLEIDDNTKNLLHKSYPEISGWIDELIKIASSKSNDRRGKSTIETAQKALAGYLRIRRNTRRQHMKCLTSGSGKK